MDPDKPEPKFQPIKLTKEHVAFIKQNKCEQDAIKLVVDSTLESARLQFATIIRKKNEFWDKLIKDNDVPKHLRNRLAFNMEMEIVDLIEVSPDQDLQDFLQSQ